MEIKPEELIYKLQNAAPLPQANLLVVHGEEDYYRQQIVTALPEAIFAGVAPEDRAIRSEEHTSELQSPS